MKKSSCKHNNNKSPISCSGKFRKNKRSQKENREDGETNLVRNEFN
jgi:hypothetical protein